ncbi:MAG: urea carboxylase [Burkholderiaceae bacterium]
MFTKVIVANRGAIAVRVCRTLKAMGIASVAVYAEDDRHSLHVRAADESLCLGSGPATETYLNQAYLIQLAKQVNADAIHPGYGFLSENASFANACEASGIVFVGPTSAQIEAFGLKHRAREIAMQHDVPVVQGSELLTSLDAATKAAQGIGYPVMLKSTAGGGGIGMQICRDDSALAAAFDSVRRLGANHFSNDGVFVEQFIEHARHIEVQVLGDGKGRAITFTERDCSSQRRNQKVLEETPAPNLPKQVREELQAAAQRLLEAVQYRGAGTVEFIYDQEREQFWFLEANTRLQVEHGITEQVHDVDLVALMLEVASGELTAFDALFQQRVDGTNLAPQGHSIQARIYAEDPNKEFQPCAGLLTTVRWPVPAESLRIDHWVEAGIDVSARYDPMLAKLIVHAPTREAAIAQLEGALNDTLIEGVETNLSYLQAVLRTDFRQGALHTRFLNEFSPVAVTVDVNAPGTMTTIQDSPGRIGYWDVGVPPSGPFDSYSFRLGNRLLNNSPDAAGLELTVQGPSLKFNSDTCLVVTGAPVPCKLDGEAFETNRVISVKAGQQLDIGTVSGGLRSYLCVAGGLQCEPYLGSRSTFTLGRFGGHGGRALRTGDVLHLLPLDPEQAALAGNALDKAITPEWRDVTVLRVIYGPHGAPDFFTDEGIKAFFEARWQVHFNSSRTGVRLIGPKPGWARSDGGEAGLHPSNIHDNGYAIGTVDFTGDMPVILGPDGPSLGGFVCPATVIHADLYKLGQLAPGDYVRFEAISLDDANMLAREQEQTIESLQLRVTPVSSIPTDALLSSSPALKHLPGGAGGDDVVIRAAGDRYLLIEVGPLKLDIRLRIIVHALMLKLQESALPGLLELTPGIRSLQVHYDSLRLSTAHLIEGISNALQGLQNIDALELPSRIVHLPLSWDDDACQQAIEKYTQVVRPDAPWCPSNIEFIRRINGLADQQAVKNTVFDASYLVLGLGDVYLGAPVATPLDPRHRLVTTKYNPARTWTAENSVGIGGSYLCVYGMEGPGGYQFVGRTLQMWNRFHRTGEFTKPWLLRFFDQIRFYEVSADELTEIREQFPHGNYPLKVEQSTFSLSQYQSFLNEHKQSIDEFAQHRGAAFQGELTRWIETGQMNFEADLAAASVDDDSVPLAPGMLAVDSPVAGSVWQVPVKPGDKVDKGQCLCIVESMKMEISVTAYVSGVVQEPVAKVGQAINAGQRLMVIASTAGQPA